MSHLRMTVADWDIDLDSAGAHKLIALIESEGTAVFRRQPGFVRYRLMHAGPRRTVAIGEWESEQVAVTGAARFREWLSEVGIRQHITLNTESGPVIVAADR